MAVFHQGAPEEHAGKAAETALSLMSVTQDINRRRGENPISLHIGLNAGVASFGATRYDGIRGSRWVFTADGPVVNLASRIADSAEAGEIFLGPHIAEHLAATFEVRSVGDRELKNVSSPTEIFQLVREVR